MKKFFLSGIMMLISLVLFAQNKTISGKVTDSTGKPLASVTVSITGKGYKKTIQTNEEGNFSVVPSVEGKFNITFSSTGFKSRTMTTEGGVPMSVSLKREVSDMEEVVINVGYGTLKKKELSSSVSSITAKDLKDVPVNSAAEALNGRLAGVTATTAEGAPDAEVNVRVRGGMSITNDNSPLYIVDGVQLENGLSSISPQDIQSIDVLKDAAATAIYGARGANGVIVISTKSGKPGKMKISYNGFVGIKYLPKTLEVMNPYDYVVYQSERSRGNGTDSLNFIKDFGTTWDTLQNYRNVSPVNWQKEVLGNVGLTTTHSVTATGGNQKMTYNFGYTYNADKAIVTNSKYYRNILNFKTDYKISKRLKAGIGIRYTNQNVFGAGVSDTKGSSYSRLRNAVKYRPFLSAGQNIGQADSLADDQVGNGLSLKNPIQLASAEYRNKITNTYNITGNISYNIKKNLSFKSTWGFERKNYVDLQFSDTTTPFSIIQGSRKPIAGLDTAITSTFTNSNVFTYSLKNFKKLHDFDFLIGEETYDLKTERYSSLFGYYPLNISPEQAFNNTDSAKAFAGYPKPASKSRYTSMSFFSRLNYSFAKVLLFSFNLRADGASKFAQSNKWGIFPATSVAFHLGKNELSPYGDIINDIKMRWGIGLVGNNRIDDYLYITNFNNDNAYYYGLNNQPVYAYYPASLPNQNLRWESTVNHNLGLDLSLFHSRIDLSFDAYDNDSKDLLLNVPIASTYGYTTQYQNVGKTNNKGYEFQLNASIVKNKKNFNWNASFNLSSNVNKVVELGVNQKSFYPTASWGVSGQPTDYIVRVGDPVGSMYGLVTDGFYTVDDFDLNYYNQTGTYRLKSGVASNASIIGVVAPGSIKFKDLNNDSIVDLAHDRTIIGNPTPKFTGGLTQTFSYKQWDASIFLNFSVGGDVYNANKIEFTNGYTVNSNLLAIMNDRWRVVTPDGQTAQWIIGNTVYGIPPDQLSALNQNAKLWTPIKGAGAFYPHSWAIEDGSFLRINNVTIGYSLPVLALAKLHMSKLRFYVTMNNLHVFTKYSGYDPEVSVRSNQLTPNLDYSAYPKSRSFIFGINASF